MHYTYQAYHKKCLVSTDPMKSSFMKEMYYIACDFHSSDLMGMHENYVKQRGISIAFIILVFIYIIILYPGLNSVINFARSTASPYRVNRVDNRNDNMEWIFMIMAIIFAVPCECSLNKENIFVDVQDDLIPWHEYSEIIVKKKQYMTQNVWSNFAPYKRHKRITYPLPKLIYSLFFL